MMRSMAQRTRVSRTGSPTAELMADLTFPEVKPLRIVVAGEIILDRYVWGDVERISPEAPIPVLRTHRR